MSDGVRVLCVLLFAVTLVFVNPITSARFFFGSAVLALSWALLRPTSAEGRRRFMAGFLFSVVMVFPVADAFRYEGGELQTPRFGADTLLDGDYESFQQTLNTLQVVERNGHRFGQQLAGAVLLPVPRSVIPSKTFPTGQYLAEQQGYSFTNLGSPFWAEGYVDFGILGAALAALVFGYAAGCGDLAFSAPGRRLAVASAVPFVLGYQLILMRGSVQAVLGTGLAWLALTLMCSRRSSQAKVADREPM